jgi:hypothetical protein
MAVNWVVKSVRQMTHRKSHGWWEIEIGNSEVTSQAIWPIAKSLMKTDGPKAPTVIHGLGLKFHTLEEAIAIAQFTPCELYDENHKWHVEARVQAFAQSYRQQPL